MTLPKSARRMIVDGEAYRWMASKANKFFTLIVEAEQNAGQKFLTRFRCSPVYQRIHGEKHYGRLSKSAAYGPSRVRQLIDAALNEGWEPHLPGLKPFRLDVPKRTAIKKQRRELNGVIARRLLQDMIFYLAMKPDIFSILTKAKPGEEFPVHLWGRESHGFTFSAVKLGTSLTTVHVEVRCNEIKSAYVTYAWE